MPKNDKAEAKTQQMIDTTVQKPGKGEGNKTRVKQEVRGIEK